MAKQTVVLVEDDPEARKIYQDLLSGTSAENAGGSAAGESPPLSSLTGILGENVDVVGFGSVAAVVAWVKQEMRRIDLLLLDVRIPLEDGQDPRDDGAGLLLNELDGFVMKCDWWERDPAVVFFSNVALPKDLDIPPDRFRSRQFVEKTFFTRAVIVELCRTHGIHTRSEVDSGLLRVGEYDTPVTQDICTFLSSRIDENWQAVERQPKEDHYCQVNSLGMFMCQIHACFDHRAFKRVVLPKDGVGKLLMDVLRRAREKAQGLDAQLGGEKRSILASIHFLMAELEGAHGRHDRGVGNLCSGMVYQLQSGLHPALLEKYHPLYRVVTRIRGDSSRCLRMIVRRLVDWSRNRKCLRALLPDALLSWADTYPSFGTESLWRLCIRCYCKRAARIVSTEMPRDKRQIAEIEKDVGKVRQRLLADGFGRDASEAGVEILRIRYNRLAAWKKPVPWFIGLVCDYGRSPLRLFVFSVIVILCFAIAYYPTPRSMAPLLPEGLAINLHPWPYHGHGVQDFVTSTYFSVVTCVTLGYGDITPNNTCGQIVCTAESVLGYIILGLFLATISNRLRPE